MNLKYSKDVEKDYEKLSNGRKSYITKRADKKGVSVPKYLKEKYVVPFDMVEYYDLKGTKEDAE